ncbi:ABC transporter permease [Ohtaekwangia koreensis]|uniref:ABC-type transport system, involved in lipoprotein release, permease component n=1 Tax=Ohtaekwangia koreensis TaxID=688867 RepID=A0A1T5MF48_9BACT|nr:ABC transporter permease [Ohtaekwangia koreensis]SKC86775.1 ABC-type transport system, involved in lipoprotein release, permease component [Ohtaekwangia koreensis]
MIKNYLLITLRSMMKNKLFIFINVFGMAIGIGCCIVAYFNWEFDASFNTHHLNSDKIYRVSQVREFENNTKLYGYTSLPMGAAIRQNIPDAEKVTRLNRSWSNYKVEDNLFPGGVAYVDPDFFDMFTFEFIDGNPADLKDKSKVFLSDELARKLFGSIDVVGKQVTQVLGADVKELTVGGIFKKQPQGSSFRFQSYMHYDNYFDDAKDVKEDEWKHWTSLFVMVNNPDRLDVIHKQLQGYRENNNKVREDFIVKEYVLDPFVGMAQRDEINDTWNETWDANSRAAVHAPTIMAVLILLIACFNMTNTSIAISSRRLKEIGIRKVMGSMRSQLIFQFIGETMFICFLSLVIGLVLGEVLLSSWNALWEEMKLTSHYIDDPGFLFFLIGILVFTGIIAGSYPAFYISGFEPVGILKGKLKLGGTNMFTRVLLCLQYAISLLAIVCSIAFYENSKYQREFDLGFNEEGVIIAYVENGNEYETYRNALVQNKDIQAVAGSKHSIFSSRYKDPVKFESKQVEVDIIDVGDDYLSTMGLTLIEGRDFKKESETDRKESIIITKKMADTFKWDKPLGKEILWHDTVKLYVVGVVKDVYTVGLWAEMEPMMLRYTEPAQYTHVIVNTPVNKLTEVYAFMEKEWKQIFPNRLYNGRYLHEEMKEAFTVNDNIVKMFVFLGIVAMTLSATGLFTLVSLNIIRKMKEIGVRKVLGASIGNITRIINTEFIVILMIASVLGCLLGYYLVDALMDSIWDYYQNTTTFTFIVSVVVMLVISGITIGYKVFSAASMNPVSTLRDE